MNAIKDLYLMAVICLLMAGCSTTDLNPAAARTDTGYVDFYTDSSLALSWEVKRADPGTGEMRTVFSEHKPVAGNILRLTASEGAQRFEVWFSNQVTTGPESVQVQVANGKVTPVHITLTPAGSTTVDRRDYGFRGSAKGYGRGTKFRTEQNEMFRIGAVAGEPQVYQPKERMAYYSPEAKP